MRELESNGSRLANDWQAYAMELWGLQVETCAAADPERAGILPEPLGYDTLNDGLSEIGTQEKLLVLQSLSRYQVWAQQDLFNRCCITY